MPRVRWLMSVPVLCIILVHALFGIDIVTADCWYENEKHEDGVEVATAEPCLNCTCSRGALLCYLRVCPKLPNPPPPGCILLHRYRSCCPELICSDVPSGNGIEGRSENEGFEIEQEKTHLEDACVLNGSIYGPGSAMDSSTDCEYCYCLRGQQRCVKPKCLLPLDGCVPAYRSNDCCPAHYNCTRSLFTSTTTTTLSPDEFEIRSGCIVDGNFYPEGGKVLGIGHSTCDNCYCLRSLVRCEPLSCAPPLLGCAPVIKPGECCAASYNCSGTIETHPEPHYGEFPTVSKEYAKLRKEVQHKRTTSKFMGGERGNTNVPFYVLAETSKTQGNKVFGQITQSPFYYNLSNIKEKYSGKHVEKNNSFPEIYYVPTKVEKTTSGEPKEFHSLATTIRHKKYANDELLKLDINDTDGRINRRIDNQNQIENQTETTITTLTDSTTDHTTLEYTTLNFEEFPTETENLKELTTTDFDSISTTWSTTTEETDSTTIENNSQSITVINTTECNTKSNETGGLQHREDDEVTTEVSVTTEEVTGITVEEEVKVGTIMTNAPVEIEVIVNGSKEHDFDYDYNPPTLPPSLPNLRIIPFVAADALDPKKNPAKGGFAQERISDTSFPFSNQFSPPVETEGGFVPKEPPLLDDFYDKNYHTTNIGTNLVTSLPVPAITNPPKSNENNCMVEGKEIKHGESVSSEGTCAICVCYFGSIVCHEPRCPIPRAGCRNSNAVDRSTCCPHLICDDEESPTVVLDRLEETSNKPLDVVTVAEGIISPDPFRHVIRTEPAPDLKLLIGDMSNFLLKQTTTTTVPPTTAKQSIAEEDSFSLDKVWQFLFSANEDKPESKPDNVFITTIATNVESSSSLDNSASPSSFDDSASSSSFDNSESSSSFDATSSSSGNLEIHRNGVETRESVNDLVRQKGSYDPPGLAYFKLAGCNIYGRMYRVGRIISELSGPCLECKCTEVGVQCATLKC